MAIKAEGLPEPDFFFGRWLVADLPRVLNDVFPVIARILAALVEKRKGTIQALCWHMRKPFSFDRTAFAETRKLNAP